MRQPRPTRRVASRTPGHALVAAVPPAILCAAWVASSLVINPVGDFPLNDDWAFGIPVEGLVRHGRLTFNYCQAMTLIVQVGWGALFCLPAGFSYTALRISTVAIGLVGVLGTYGLLLETGSRRWLAFAGAATLAMNPVYLGMSHTFMTDVPFAATFTVGLYYLARGLNREQTSSLLMGLTLAFLSMFIRQLGLAIFVGLCLGSLVKWGFGRRWLLLGFLPLAGAGTSLAAYSSILKALGKLPHQYGQKPVAGVLNDLIHLQAGALKVPSFAAFLTMMYLGLFLLPFLVLTWPAMLGRLDPGRRRGVILGSAAVAGAITAVLASLGWLMPLTGNVVVDFGQGIRSIVGPEVPVAPRPLWLAVTAAAALGASSVALTLAVSVRAAWRGRKVPSSGPVPAWLVVLLIAAGVAHCAPFSLMYAIFFDRYFLPLIGITMALTVGLMGRFAPLPGPGAWAGFAVMTLAYGSFAIGSTHDLLDWNRVRWAAIDELVAREGVGIEAIDGGFEFNNWEPNRALMESGGVGELVDRSGALYAVAKGPVAGFATYREYECHPWLPYAISRVLILKRTGPEARVLRGRGDEGGESPGLRRPSALQAGGPRRTNAES